MNNVLMGGLVALPIFILWLGLIVLSIYTMVLFIKFMKRGIRAFDIYISRNENSNETDRENV